MTFETTGPLGIVFRSTVPSADGRAFVKALRAESAAAKHAQLCAALTDAEVSTAMHLLRWPARTRALKHTLRCLRCCRRRWDTSWCCRL